MTMRDIVMAQIRHEETDFVPYEFRADEDAEAMLTKHYGSEDWKKNVIEPFEKGPYFFDSWQVMKNIDPNDPTKKEDPFGCLWTITKEIAHLDRCAMWNSDPRDYVWPTLKDFYWPERQALLKQWNDSLTTDRFSLVDMGAGYWEHMWRLFGVEDALILTVEEPDTFEYILDCLDKMFHQFLDILLQTKDVLHVSRDMQNVHSNVLPVSGKRASFTNTNESTGCRTGRNAVCFC